VVNLSGVGTAPLSTSTDTNITITDTNGALAADTLNVDLSTFSKLNTLLNGHKLTITLVGGDEAFGTGGPVADHLNLNNIIAPQTTLTTQTTSTCFNHVRMQKQLSTH
jgi:hypothetical protein